MSNSSGLVGIILLVAFLVLPGCNSPDHRPVVGNTWPAAISVSGDHFVDNFGREVILNGINVVNKSKEEGYMFSGGPEFYANLSKWGFNSIRFIIIWDGLEPEPGVYDEKYLSEIDKRIQWAGENGLFVILDMHQDLYSVKYSDGAPEWATLDDGKEHLTGAIWSDSYMLSQAVQTSFDNFWENKPAPDGIGLQDHYAAIWQHLANRYKDNTTVIGYDLMNEPFPGSMALEATASLLNQYGKLVYHETGEVMTPEEVGGVWADEASRAEALKLMGTRESYAFVMDTLYHLNRRFETEKLQPMYQKVANSIREVDQNHILFLEHSYYSNTGVKTSIQSVTLADGSPDPNVAYAPHAYDLVTDTKAAAASSSERLSLIFERIREKGNQLTLPVWLGEWGAYYSHDESIVDVARSSVSLIEEHLMGNAYWSYDPGTEDQEYFQQALLRPYPAYTNGELTDYSYDFTSGIFSVSWIEEESDHNPTVIYIPWLSKFPLDQLDDGAFLEKMENADAGWWVIPASGSGDTRELDLQFYK